jgi:hypothetical protein
MWLEDWKESGKKAWSYAKENGLIPQTFCTWVKRGELKNAGGFVEIPDRLKPRQEAQQEIRIEKGDIKIHIPLFVWTENSRAIMESLRVAL